jgi:uncharacterized protein (TIRG00374 family)
MKQRHLWIGLGISLIFLLLLLVRIDYSELKGSLTSARWPSRGTIQSRIDYGRLWISLGTANPTLLLLGGGLITGTLAVRAWRWRYFLKPLKAVGFSSVMSATSIGMMANMLFPARLGELVRAFVLGQRERLDVSASFATVIVERLLDGFAILVILAVLLVGVPLPLEAGLERALRWGGLVGLAVNLGLFMFLLYLHRSTTQAMRGVRRVCSLLPRRWGDRLYSMLEGFSGGLQTLGRWDSLGQIVVASALLWGAIGLYNFLVLLAFQLQLPLAVGFLLLVFQAFAVMLPSSPGFVGTYHAASVACLSLWGVQAETALSVVLVMHALGFFTTIAAGFVCLWAIGLSPRDLTRASLAVPHQPSSSPGR